MKRVIFSSACGLLFTTSVAFAQGSRETEPIPTVCSISANPGFFDGKTVSISAQFESDGVERTVLTDSNCPKVGIAIEGKARVKGEEMLLRALQMGHPGTLDKRITGTFTGK